MWRACERFKIDPMLAAERPVEWLREMVSFERLRQAEEAAEAGAGLR